MEPRLKWNENVLACVTNGDDSGMKFFNLILFYFNMEPRLKWNKMFLPLKQFYFISDVVRTWFHVKIEH